VPANSANANTLVALPANDATVSGNDLLDAGAAPVGVTSVNFIISGGPDGLANTLISGSAPTIYGWIGPWNTASAPEGT
jgi:hypothetical protein